MELTGDLNKKAEQAANKEKTIEGIKETVRLLSDDKLDKVSGGGNTSSGEDSSLREEQIEAAKMIQDIREDAGRDHLEWDVNLENVADARSREARESFFHAKLSGI